MRHTSSFRIMDLTKALQFFSGAFRNIKVLMSVSLLNLFRAVLQAFSEARSLYARRQSRMSLFSSSRSAFVHRVASISSFVGGALPSTFDDCSVIALFSAGVLDDRSC